MRKILLVLLTTTSLVLGSTLVAEGALPAYRVTLSASKATSSAGAFVVLSGKVVGPRAVGRRVTLQRRYVGGPWVNVAFATVRSNGTYAARVETPRGGTTSFRAVKPRSAVRAAGVSAVRALKVYEWLYLASQAGTASEGIVRGAEVVIDGKSYRRSIFFGSTNGSVSYRLDGLCTAFATAVAYRTVGEPAADAMSVVVSREQIGSSPQQNTTTIDSDGSAATITSTMVRTRILTIATDGIEPGGAYAATLGDPKVYCNASYLPGQVVSSP